MVLTQQEDEDGYIYESSSFPYHYGSHATYSGRTLYQQVQGFPYHYGSHATKIAPNIRRITVLCFHTTMVLTQQAVAKQPVKPILFPYHYGSHAT